MKATLKTAFAIFAISVGSVVWTLSQNSGPIFPVTDNSLAGWIKDTNGYPFVHATGVTIDTSSLTNLSVTTATNVSSVITDRTNTALVTTTGKLNVSADISGGTNYSYLLGTNYMAVAGTITVSPTASSNQVSWCVGATNVANNATNAGVATYCAWFTTNAPFNIAGGSGILNSITFSSGTNRDFVVWVFNKLPTATFTNAAVVVLGPADMQYCVGNWATTNSQFGDWQILGTNYQKTLSGLGMPIKNNESSQNLYILATHLDTKSNYTAASTYVRSTVINDK